MSKRKAVWAWAQNGLDSGNVIFFLLFFPFAMEFIFTFLHPGIFYPSQGPRMGFVILTLIFFGLNLAFCLGMAGLWIYSAYRAGQRGRWWMLGMGAWFFFITLVLGEHISVGAGVAPFLLICYPLYFSLSVSLFYPISVFSQLPGYSVLGGWVNGFCMICALAMCGAYFWGRRKRVKT